MPKGSILFSGRTLAGAIAALVALASGCTYSQGTEPSPCADTVPATYAAVVSPIFDASCRKCHGSTVYQTLGGGNDYSDYKGIKRQSATLLLGSINHTTGYDAMPKGGAKLSVCDIARIQSWIDAGQLDN